MSGFFSVVNFDALQHYKDRSPPWIKLYNSLLDSYEFAQLPDASKAHLLAIYLLASRNSNKIPADPEWIKTSIKAHENVDLNLLVKFGFIEPDQECSKMLASCEQVAPQRERERDIESKSTTGVVIDLFGEQKPEPAEQPEPETPYTPLKEFWDLGPSVLEAAGVEKKAIRGLMGKLQKARRPDECCRILELMAEEPPVAPVPWLMSWCNPARRVPFGGSARPPPIDDTDAYPFAAGITVDRW